MCSCQFLALQPLYNVECQNASCILLPQMASRHPSFTTIHHHVPITYASTYHLLSSCTSWILHGFFMVFPTICSFGLRPLTSSLPSRDSPWHHPWSAEAASPTKPWRTAQMGFLAVEAGRYLAISNGHIESVATLTLEASARR